MYQQLCGEPKRLIDSIREAKAAGHRNQNALVGGLIIDILIILGTRLQPAVQTIAGNIGWV